MARSTNASTTYEVRDIGLAGGRRNKEYRQRVQLYGGSSHIACGFNIPARSRVVWYKLLNVSDIVTCGNATNSALAAGLVMFPTTSTSAVTAPPTTGSFSATASNVGTNGIVIGHSITTSSNAVGRGMPRITTVGNCQNTTTVEAYLCLLPIQTGTGTLDMVYSPGNVNTAGMVFGSNSSVATTVTAGIVEVCLEVETFEDSPSW